MFMSGCTVFVFLSLMEYALVNIVMGDIADIEKKKNSGLTNLLLGVRAGAGPGMPGAPGVSQKPQKSFQAMQVVFVNFYIDVCIFSQYFIRFYVTFPCWLILSISNQFHNIIHMQPIDSSTTLSDKRFTHLM